MSHPSRVLPLAAVSLAVLLAACGKGPAPEGGPGAHGGPPPVSVAPVTQRQIQDIDEFSARLEATDSVEVRSRVAGTLEKVHFVEGQRVKAGDLLYTIDAKPFNAEVARLEAQLASIRTQSALAAAELARAEKLLPMQAVSQQEVDALRATQRQAESGVAAARAGVDVARLSLSYTRITAPISGRVSRFNLTAGNLVAAGEPALTTIVSSDRVYAWFDASEDTYLKFMKTPRAAGAAANVVRMGLSNETGYPHQGKLDFVDNRLNPATGSIRARAVFDNRDGRFTPGLSARVQLVGSAPVDATLVPDRAIATDQNRKVVMTIGPNNIVTPRVVQTGTLIEGMRVVTGVKAGEQIVVDGLLRAMPGAPVTPQVVKVDEKGMPIPPTAAPAPGAPPAPAPAASSAPASAPAKK